jgi:hypothetical protein
MWSNYLPLLDNGPIVPIAASLRIKGMRLLSLAVFGCAELCTCVSPSSCQIAEDISYPNE